jgi:hypothetical protein
MEHIVLDFTELIRNPKEAFRRITTYESLTYPIVFLFICGILMGFRKYLEAHKTIPMLPPDQIPFAYGMRDADSVLAFLTPFLVVGFWFLCTLMVHLVAEKMGSTTGELNEVLLATGYLSILLLVFLLLTFPLYYFGVINGVKIFSLLNSLVTLMFIAWMFYLVTQILDAVCGVPMAYASISIVITFLAFSMIYYGMIEWVLIKMFIANFFAKKY